MRYLIAASLVAAFLGACDLTGSRQRAQRPGLLRLSPEDSIDFVAPDTVQLNTTFGISVTTFGGSCEVKGPTDVLILSDGNVEFRPYDVIEFADDRACPLETQTFTHSGTLNATAAGTRNITLWGRDWSGVATSRVKTVVIRP